MKVLFTLAIVCLGSCELYAASATANAQLTVVPRIQVKIDNGALKIKANEHISIQMQKNDAGVKMLSIVLE